MKLWFSRSKLRITRFLCWWMLLCMLSFHCVYLLHNNHCFNFKSCRFPQYSIDTWRETSHVRLERCFFNLSILLREFVSFSPKIVSFDWFFSHRLFSYQKNESNWLIFSEFVTILWGNLLHLIKFLRQKMSLFVKIKFFSTVFSYYHLSAVKDEELIKSSFYDRVIKCFTVMPMWVRLSPEVHVNLPFLLRSIHTW